MFGYFLNRSALVVSFYMSVCKNLLFKTHRHFLLSSVWFPLLIFAFLPQPSLYNTLQCYTSYHTFLFTVTSIRVCEEFFSELCCKLFHKAEQVHIFITRTISSSFQQIIQYIIRQWELHLESINYSFLLDTLSLVIKWIIFQQADPRLLHSIWNKLVPYKPYISSWHTH